MDIKTERQGIYRTQEGFLVNKDYDGLKAYRSRKNSAKKIFEVEAEVASLKADLDEIKEMIKELARK